MYDPLKVVIIDLDETLGYFIEFGIFFEALNAYLKYDHIHGEPHVIIDQLKFNQLLDLYPEFIRPNIYPILNYLKHKMKLKEFKGVMIYTNNQGPRTWVTFIKNYLESKIKYKLFIQIIAGFKVNGKQIELCRTSHEKTLNDFFRCTKLPQNTQLCFLDDVYHPYMNSDNVYYIKIKPYTYDLSFDTMIKRFLNSSIGNHLITTKEKEDKFFIFMQQYMLKFQFLYVKKSDEEYEIDKIVTKKTMVHLQYFFNKHKPYQLKNINKNINKNIYTIDTIDTIDNNTINNNSRRYGKTSKNKTLKRKNKKLL